MSTAANTNRVWKIIAAAAYVLILAYIVLLAPARAGHTIRPKDRVKLVPVKGTLDELLHYRGNVWAEHLMLFTANFVGNLFLFIPFPFMLMYVFGMSDSRRIVLTALLVSVGIELLQYWLVLGVADIDDVLLNTGGAVIGVWLCRILNKKLNHSTTDEN